MGTPGNVDYHVHYHLDGCAADEMTLIGIEREALRLGLDEVCIVKHYSRELPNGLDSWAHWKRIVPEQFDVFLADVAAHRASSRLRMLRGVETELVDESGELNIAEDDARKLDALILSVHWLPRMSDVAVDPALIPDQVNEGPPDVVERWRGEVRKVGVSRLAAKLVSAYTRAVERAVRPLVLGHMGDGLAPLRHYGVAVDDLSDGELCVLMEPLMEACRETGTLWELTRKPVVRPPVVRRAGELGVQFVATADAHSLGPDGWACLTDHAEAESYVTSLGVAKGVLADALR